MRVCKRERVAIASIASFMIGQISSHELRRQHNLSPLGDPAWACKLIGRRIDLSAVAISGLLCLWGDQHPWTFQNCWMCLLHAVTT